MLARIQEQGQLRLFSQTCVILLYCSAGDINIWHYGYLFWDQIKCRVQTRIPLQPLKSRTPCEGDNWAEYGYNRTSTDRQSKESNGFKLLTKFHNLDQILKLLSNFTLLTKRWRYT